MSRKTVITSSLVVLLTIPGPVPPLLAHESDSENESAEVMVVAGVAPGGPAEMAGLAKGDRVLSWAGEHLQTQADLSSFLGERLPGDVVPLRVERGGEILDIALKLGDRGDGQPRLGVSIGVAQAPPGQNATADNLSADECRAWIGDTYRVDTRAAEFGLELEAQISDTRACVDRDLAQMPATIPRGWCDNVFKVHCSGLDLLAEIGEAMVDRCERELSESMGVDLAGDETWNVCAEPKIFDAYSLDGHASDAGACRKVLVEECAVAPGGSGA